MSNVVTINQSGENQKLYQQALGKLEIVTGDTISKSWPDGYKGSHSHPHSISGSVWSIKRNTSGNVERAMTCENSWSRYEMELCVTKLCIVCYCVLSCVTKLWETICWSETSRDHIGGIGAAELVASLLPHNCITASPIRHKYTNT